MFCRNCGAEMEENQAICLKCGFKAGDGKKYCSHCGNEVAEGATVCLSCGFPVDNKKGGAAGSVNGDYLNGKDKITMALICFFLGGIGIHNFMLGETKKGVVKIVASLCLCGIGGILALIDFIKILTDKYEVNPDALF